MMPKFYLQRQEGHWFEGLIVSFAVLRIAWHTNDMGIELKISIYKSGNRDGNDISYQKLLPSPSFYVINTWFVLLSLNNAKIDVYGIL